MLNEMHATSAAIAPNAERRILIHIGLGKAGSSALQLWFSKHPHLRPLESRAIVRAALSEEFSPPHQLVLSDERLSLGMTFDAATGEIHSPCGVKEHQRRAAEMLAEHLPNARILLVTRGFEGFIRSLYSQYLRKGGALLFNGFFNAYGPLIADSLDINHLYDLYEERFGPGSVIVLPYELMSEDPQRFFAELHDQIGAPRWKLPRKRFNVRLNEDQFAVYPRLSRVVRGLCARLPPRPRRSVLKFYTEFVLRSPVLELTSRVLARLMGRRWRNEPVVPADYLAALGARASVLETFKTFAPYQAAYHLRAPS